MKRMIRAVTGYVDYDVTVSFGGYVGAVEDIVVYAKEGATEEDIMDVVIDEFRDELLEGEVIEFDGEDEYVVEVTFGGYIGVSEEYTEYADDEDDAIEQAVYEATWELAIESFAPAE